MNGFLRAAALCAALGLLAAPAAGATTVFNNRLDFLEFAGPLSLQTFESTPVVGDPTALPMLPFPGFTVSTQPDAVKILDGPRAGNQNTTPGGTHYLGLFAPALGQTAKATLTFSPPVLQVGFQVIDLDTFQMNVTINGATYPIPPTGDAGVAFFGIYSDVPIDEIVLMSAGGDVSYSLDDVSYPPPPAADPAGAVLGMVPGQMLIVSPGGGEDLLLQWGDSCRFRDTDYEIYEGVLGDYESHRAVTCTTGGGNSALITPRSGGTYYLVVPRNLQREGSYGLDSAGLPRYRPVAACLLQEVFSCL